MEKEIVIPLTEAPITTSKLDLPSNRVISILSCSVGNLLEWYDFGLFTIFSALFSQLFFPIKNPHVAIIATFSVFAIGFLCRPLGAILFGYMGDKSGRAKTLRLSVLMISLPTLLIGCIPTYQQVGLLAPLLLLLTRVWQGISIGGEYSGNLIYLAETAQKNHRALFTSFACMGANLGILLAALVGIFISYFFTPTLLQHGAWRIPYLISGILSLLIYFFRLRISETDVFTYLKKENKLAINPIKMAFAANYLQILRVLGLVCMGSTFYYFCFLYIPLFLSENLQFSIRSISIIMSFYVGAMLILVPIAGFLCDRIGRRKLLLFNAIFITLIVIPGFYLLQLHSLTLFLFVMSMFTLASSAEQGTTPAAVVENFPARTRYTGVSFGYNLGNGLLGGTIPMICAWLTMSSGFILAPAFYIALCAIITGLVTYFYVPETCGKNLCQ